MENLTTTTSPDEGQDKADFGAILGIMTYSLLAITIMFSNTIVIVTYWTERRVWQNNSHLFILHLSIADFMVGFSIFPLTIVSLSAGRWPFGEIPCKIVSAFNYIVTYIPGLFILSVTAFRLFLVTNFSRENVVKRKHVMWVIFFLWLCAIGVYLLLAFAWPGITEFDSVDYDSECLLEYLYHKHMSLFMIFFEFVIPFVFLLTLSFGLFWKIRQRSRGIRNISWRVAETCTNASPPQQRSLKQNQAGNEDQVPPTQPLQDLTLRKLCEEEESVLNPGTSDGDGNDCFDPDEVEKRKSNKKGKQGLESLESKSDVGSGVQTEKHLDTQKVPPIQQSQNSVPRNESRVVIGSASQNRITAKTDKSSETTQHSSKDSIRGHRKAAIMLFAIVAAFVICWLPYVIISLLFLVYPDIVSSTVFETISGTLYLNSLINPVLYGMTNVHFRRGFVKVLHLPRRWLQ